MSLPSRSQNNPFQRRQNFQHLSLRLTSKKPLYPLTQLSFLRITTSCRRPQSTTHHFVVLPQTIVEFKNVMQNTIENAMKKERKRASQMLATHNPQQEVPGHLLFGCNEQNKPQWRLLKLWVGECEWPTTRKRDEHHPHNKRHRTAPPYVRRQYKRDRSCAGFPLPKWRRSLWSFLCFF